jgi:pimeloyl-ACP methyl ester carboxylesterase
MVGFVPYSDVRGARLFYTDEGQGSPTMVFVHGFSCDSHDWSWQLSHFCSSHRTIALDLRGHGRSSAPDNGYDVASLAADVASLIDQLATGPVIALGHSLGGAIVASMAVERPDLVAAVVAIDPGHLLPDEAAPALAAVLETYEHQDPASVARNAFDELSHTAATPPALAMWHNRRAAGVSVHVLRKTIAGLIGGPEPFALRANSESYLSRVSCPVLSFYTDPLRARIAASIFGPPSRTVCFEASGHWLHQERPLEANSIIDSWLACILPRTGPEQYGREAVDPTD